MSLYIIGGHNNGDLSVKVGNSITRLPVDAVEELWEFLGEYLSSVARDSMLRLIITESVKTKGVKKTKEMLDFLLDKEKKK